MYILMIDHLKPAVHELMLKLILQAPRGACMSIASGTSLYPLCSHRSEETEMDNYKKSTELEVVADS
jgi:hypothetical protein